MDIPLTSQELDRLFSAIHDRDMASLKKQNESLRQLAKDFEGT